MFPFAQRAGNEKSFILLDFESSNGSSQRSACNRIKTTHHHLEGNFDFAKPKADGRRLLPPREKGGNIYLNMRCTRSSIYVALVLTVWPPFYCERNQYFLKFYINDYYKIFVARPNLQVSCNALRSPGCFISQANI